MRRIDRQYIKRLMILAAICMLVAHVSGCVSLGEQTVTMNAQQIAQKLNQQFSQPVPFLKVMSAQFSQAEVDMDAANNRIQTQFNIAIHGPLLARPVSGQVRVSGGLRFDQQRQAILLMAPSIERLIIRDASPAIQPLVEDFARQQLGRWLDGILLYQLQADKLTLAGTRFQPTRIQVTAAGVQVTLSPQP